MAGERQLCCRRGDLGNSLLAIVEKDALAEAQRCGESLASDRRDTWAVDKHAERIPEAAVGVSKDLQAVRSDIDFSKRALAPRLVLVEVLQTDTSRRDGRTVRRAPNQDLQELARSPLMDSARFDQQLAFSMGPKKVCRVRDANRELAASPNGEIGAGCGCRFDHAREHATMNEPPRLVAGEGLTVTVALGTLPTEH